MTSKSTDAYGSGVLYDSSGNNWNVRNEQGAKHTYHHIQDNRTANTALYFDGCSMLRFPNTTEMNIRIPTDKMNAPMAFKFQYLDYLGAPAELETFAQGAIFDGDNVYIEGDGKLLSGSVFIGN